MFTVVGYSQSLNSGGVLTGVNALVDQHVRTAGLDIIVPVLNQVVAVFHTAISATRAQLRTPSVRREVNPEIKPLNLAAAIPGNPPPWVDYTANPIAMTATEAMDMFVAGSEAAAEQKTGCVWLADGPLKPVAGSIFTVRATATVTLVAFAWTLGSLTFDQSLPVGNWNIVGARAQSAGLIAFRFVFVGGIWRPGGIGVPNVNNLNPTYQRFGGWGIWGTFAAIAPPSVEFLSGTADTAETLEIDLQPAGGA